MIAMAYFAIALVAWVVATRLIYVSEGLSRKDAPLVVAAGLGAGLTWPLALLGLLVYVIAIPKEDK